MMHSLHSIFLTSPHRRWNPLKREWVLVSPHRTQRPWQGQTETPYQSPSIPYDPHCYLCPGNIRAGGEVTPNYTGTFVFENDFAALKPDVPPTKLDIGNLGLIRAATESGICRVLCFDQRHDLTLATMPLASIERVIDMWSSQSQELSTRPDVAYVQIFENRGAMMGASNPHPHGQIWATQHIPNESAIELASQSAYFKQHATPLLVDYLTLELEHGERIVIANDTWVALVPFWAVWPFEVLLIPRSGVDSIQAISPAERSGLAVILQRLTSGYNRVFETPFPYSMGLHGAPADGVLHPEWTLHLHFFPPLLRSAAIRKFMVGFELLGSPQRDITPEFAAATIRQAIYVLESQ